MQSGSIVVALHVLTAFAAVAFLIVPGWILEKVAHTHDIALIRKTYSLAMFHGKVGGPLAILILPLGLAAATTNGIPLTSGWLVASYVVYALVVAIGIGYHMRREIRIAGMAAATSGDNISPELTTVIDDPLAPVMSWTSAILWTLLILLMVLKPF